MSKILVNILISSFCIVVLQAQGSGLCIEIHHPSVFSNKRNYYSDVNGFLGATFGLQLTNTKHINYGLKYKFDQLLAYKSYEGISKKDRKSFLVHHIIMGLQSLI